MKIMNWIKGPQKTEAPAPKKPKAQPHTSGEKPGGGAFILTPFGLFLSTCSIAWTTLSVVDLLGIGAVGLTVAGSLDLIWIAVMYATHKEIPFYGSLRATQAIGWIFLVAVVAALAWHGISLEGQEFFGYTVDENASRAMAIVGPLLPVGAKIVWVFVSSAYKKAEREAANPDGYTDEQLAEIDELERSSRFDAMKASKDLESEERAHEVELRRIKMQGDQVLAQEMADHKVTVARHKNAQEMRRISPFAFDEPRVIQGEIERTDREKQALPAAKARAPRSEVSVRVTDLSEAQKQNKLLAAEFYLARRKDAALSQAAFAKSKGISGGQLSRILDRFKEGELEAEGELGTESA